ncbi:MAG: hypothetical protein OHK0056_29040 [Bacteriovoracaceae bacterium]
MEFKISHEQKEKMILKELAKKGAATANEIIDTLFRRDLRKGSKYTTERGWRFYVHLNKHYSVLQKRGMIKNRGFKKGPSGKLEKIWVLSPKSIDKYFPDITKKKDIKLRIKNSVKKLREKTKKGR